MWEFNSYPSSNNKPGYKLISATRRTPSSCHILEAKYDGSWNPVGMGSHPSAWIMSNVRVVASLEGLLKNGNLYALI